MNAVVLIPAHNEAASIAGVLEEIAGVGLALPVVVVDDGSADRTGPIAAAHGATVVTHSVNLGYLRAIQTGMLFARARSFDYCFTFDADGQHDATSLVTLRERALGPDHPDIVVGSRFLVETGYDTPWARKVGMTLFSLLTGWVTGQRIHDTTSGLRCWSRAAMDLAVTEGMGDLHSEMIICALLCGLKVAEVPATVRPRATGVSMYSLFAALAYPFKTLLTAVILTRRARRTALPSKDIER
jgi:glycosyltransferase involved in cell wall biosynthesis